VSETALQGGDEEQIAVHAIAETVNSLISRAKHCGSPEIELTSAEPVSDSAHFNASARGYTLRTGWVIESRMRDTMRLRWI
jgi:hypothetical protein